MLASGLLRSWAPTWLAHAFGQRYDSPISPLLFAVGGGLVVLLSFAVVQRRAGTLTQAAPADVVTPPVASAPAGITSVVVLALLVGCGLVGAQEVAENLLPSAFWVVAWVAVPLAVGLVGDFTGPANPFATLARWGDNGRVRQAVIARPALAWPRWAGWWVAVALYFVAVVGELVVNNVATVPRVLAAALAVYALVCFVGGLVFGAQAWNTRAELFTVVLATWGRLGWWRFRAPGRRGFGGGLDVPFEGSLSRVVLVLLLLVSVSFDGLLSTPQWTRFTSHLPSALAPGSDGYDSMAIALFAGLTALTLVVFTVFAVGSARAGAHGGSALAALTGLLPSLLPIAYGYLLSHYLQYILINGQLLAPLLGNPVGQPWWPLHLPYPFNDTYEVNTGIMPTSVVWYVQIVVIVAAHIVAVVLANTHLRRTAPAPDLARRSEWPWLVAMVGYTMVSLWLLSQPLVQEGTSSAEGARGTTVVVADSASRTP